MPDTMKEDYPAQARAAYLRQVEDARKVLKDSLMVARTQCALALESQDLNDSRRLHFQGRLVELDYAVTLDDWVTQCRSVTSRVDRIADLVTDTVGRFWLRLRCGLHA